MEKDLKSIKKTFLEANFIKKINSSNGLSFMKLNMREDKPKNFLKHLALLIRHSAMSSIFQGLLPSAFLQ